MTKIDLRPSGVSLHFTKHKANTGEINGLQRHNERTPGGRHGNKNIVDERTKDNIFLIEDDRKLNKRVEDTIVENRNGGLKGVRQNAVRMVEGTVQLSGKVLDQPEGRQVEILKDSFAYLQDTFGKDNFVSAVIHLDETHPHLHFDFVPIEDGRLTAKTIISPNRLKTYQSDFLKHLQDNNPDLNFQRGTGEHNGLSQKDFERLMAEKARIEKELGDREEAVTRKESDLSGLEAKEKSLNFREKLMNYDKKKNQRDSDELEKKKKELGDREKNVADKEEKVKTLYQAKAKELGDREKNVADKEEKVKTLYQAKAKELGDREKNVAGREDAVERREKASDAREKGLDDEVAQRTAERFAEATGMMTDAKRREREADEKDKKADKKLADAEAKDKDAGQKLSRVNNLWNNIQQALNRIVERIKHGDLKPEEVEDTVEKYNPVTEDNVDDFMLDMNDLVDDNQINL